MKNSSLEIATFAAGCFWGVEEAFHHVKGVKETIVGYTGGHTENPNYEGVCSDTTGHAEAVQIQYDPKEISYEEFLMVFWNMHDPTQFHRQGPDVGSQYRSAIFYHNKEQEEIAKKSKEMLEKSGRYKQSLPFSGEKRRERIVTEIVPAATFWRAEEYHQKYYHKHNITSCRFPG